MAVTVEQVLRDRSLLQSLHVPSSQCPHCNVTIQETITGKRWIPEITVGERRIPAGFGCSDCFYELLGAEIEQHPILTGGVRRG